MGGVRMRCTCGSIRPEFAMDVLGGRVGEVEEAAPAVVRMPPNKPL
jgi:hypothetical protein